MRNSHRWQDAASKDIQAHGGWILPYQGSYLWYGEDRDTEDGQVRGIHLYESKDLALWEDRGIVFDAGVLAARGYPICERPRMLRSEATGRFVLWMHVDDEAYGKAQLAVAEAEAPEGPFRLVRIFSPAGEEARDFTLWQTEDAAYLVYASVGNSTLHLMKLTSDLESVEEGFVRILPNQERESPCAFSWQGAQFLLTSGCGGWRPTAALLARAESPEGPWKLVDNPCRGRSPYADAHETFGGQASCVFLAEGQPVALLDHWFPRNLSASGYSLLPLVPSHERHPFLALPWRDDSFCLRREEVQHPRFRAIVLTDCANEADDAFALAYTLLSPSIEVRAVVAQHFGLSGSAKASFDEAARTMDLAGPAAADVLLLMGASSALGEGSDEDAPGVAALVREAEAEDERPLYLLAMGPLTDVALALKQSSAVAEHAMLVWIGGGRYPEGTHEANCARDIRAAQEVFSSGMRIWQIPSGAYKKMRVPLSEIRCRIAPAGPLGAHLAGQLVRFKEGMQERASWIQDESWVMGDMAAPAALLAETKDLWEERPAPAIAEDGSYRDAGPDARTIRVYHDLDVSFAMNDFICKLEELARQEG
ncbi:MAG: nucleoside hydrolase [Atopobiaceae bacterium]